ncbi:MAG: DoxX family protein [Acidobacteriota bacterium]
MELSKTKNTLLWVLQILLAIFYIAQAVLKLMGSEEVVANFKRWGFPSGFHLVIGGVELLGGLLLLFPKTAAYAAIGLILVMIGAAFTHILNGEGAMVIMPIIPLLLLAVVAYFRGGWGTKGRLSRLDANQ